MIWLVLIIILCCFFYVAFLKPSNYWKDRNVPHTNRWPFFGNILPLVTRQKSFFQTFNDLYNEFPNERFSGSYQFGKASLCLRDPDLIKQVTIKDFNHFVNRTPQISADTDKLMARSLTSLEDEKWRQMRTTLTPSFTGSKMRFLFNLVSDCAIQFSKYFETLDSDVIEIEMKETSSRFANDVIATSAFGITTDSLNRKDNEFFQKGQELTNISPIRILVFLLNMFFPPLKKILKISVFSPRIMEFYQGIIDETIKSREDHGTVRPDMIHLLMESRKGVSHVDHETTSERNYSTPKEGEYTTGGSINNAKLTNQDIAAQGLNFFFAGFETASSLASFMSYELALNKDAQSKLQAEIDEVVENSEGMVTYDQVMGMKYLDMVVSESLRKWSPAILMERICNQDYVIKGRTENEKSVVVEKGVSIVIPILAIQRDPKYFPNPDQFDPERFSDENKHTIVPFSYLPFGSGPRSCVAARFALMEAKILFFHLLSKFNIVTTEKTQIPLKISKTALNLRAEGGVNIGLQRRN